ncbi:hypothetical protein JGU66_11390 [Myxococcaceae bacterium JPH2]|nr:hypothetical protein [Myxococcaceae bacterium JPH2]
MATAVVLLVGMLAVMAALLAASKQNRRNLVQTQATHVAEQELERIAGTRCDNIDRADPCANIKRMDQTQRKVFWSANGEPSDSPSPPGAQPQLEYDVAIDVDPPFEGSEVGSPSLTRLEATVPLANVLNVRVTVSWELPGAERRAVALQTRVAP